MKLSIATCALVLALSGCAMFSKPDPIYIPKEVKIEVPVKCVRPAIDKPTYDFNTASKTNTLFSNIALLAAENDSLAGYTLKLEAALQACSQ